MAIVHPQGWQALSAMGAAERELQTLALLASGLPDNYTVWHGVHWTRIRDGHQVIGEIDFVIVGPSGRVLLIEQKSGFLTETEQGLAKTYAGGVKNVPVQMQRTLAAIDARLRRLTNGQKTSIDALLYCPDYTVKNPGSAGVAPERIVDARRRDGLLGAIRDIVGMDEPDQPGKPVLGKFFSDILQLVPEASAVIGEAQTLYTRLSGGLAAWARRIEVTPHRLRVTATAGSGKTQLAMAVYRDALAVGQRPLYVCYNRPLADHVAHIAPAGGVVSTYHQLCERIARAQGIAPDYGVPGAFAALEDLFDRHAPGDGEMFDTLIVDEGQDFHQTWAANVMKMLAPLGRAWWLEDPMQNLYGRPSVALPGWVGLRAGINHRSPRDILAWLNRLLPVSPALESGSPLTGPEVEILTYTDTPGLLAQTVKAVTNCVARGFKRETVAIVTYRGRENSVLTPYDRLGPYALRAFTGRYDLLGNPIYTEGDLVIDSVHRFKGQAAPAVVFTEVDFGALDELAARRIFVGATRATMTLVLVVSERAARVLSARLDG